MLTSVNHSPGSPENFGKYFPLLASPRAFPFHLYVLLQTRRLWWSFLSIVHLDLDNVLRRRNSCLSKSCPRLSGCGGRWLYWASSIFEEVLSSVPTFPFIQ